MVDEGFLSSSSWDFKQSSCAGFKFKLSTEVDALLPSVKGALMFLANYAPLIVEGISEVGSAFRQPCRQVGSRVWTKLNRD